MLPDSTSAAAGKQWRGDTFSRVTRSGLAPLLLAGGALLRAMAATPSPPAIRFREAAGAGGLVFRLANHPTPHKHLPETVAGGLAIFDYDGDGRPDVFFTNGAALPSMEKESPPDWNRLFHNEGGLRFTDVTDRAGVRGRGYSMGAAAGDY